MRGEGIAGGLEGEVGVVALLREVGEVHVGKVGMVDVEEEVGRLLVGEVPLFGEDARFVDGRAARGVYHGGLVVRLEDQTVAVAEDVADGRGHVAEIGADAEFVMGCLEDEADGVERIVRNGKGRDGEVGKVKELACGEDLEAGFGLECGDNAARGGGVGEDGEIVTSRKDGEPLDVIGVLVCDEDRRERCGIDANF